MADKFDDELRMEPIDVQGLEGLGLDTPPPLLVDIDLDALDGDLQPLDDTPDLVLLPIDVEGLPRCKPLFFNDIGGGLVEGVDLAALEGDLPPAGKKGDNFPLPVGGRRRRRPGP